MSNKVPVKIARTMYELQDRCAHSYWCNGCPAYVGRTCRIKAGKDGVPAGWDIKEEDILRLEREEM